jgi:hypothetical protein
MKIENSILIILFIIPLFGYSQEELSISDSLFIKLSTSLKLNVTSICYHFKSDSSIEILALSYRKKNKTIDLIDNQIDSIFSRHQMPLKDPLLNYYLVKCSAYNVWSKNRREKEKWDLLDFLNKELKLPVFFLSTIIENDLITISELSFYGDDNKQHQLSNGQIDSVLNAHKLYISQKTYLRSTDHSIILNRR